MMGSINIIYDRLISIGGGKISKCIAFVSVDRKLANAMQSNKGIFHKASFYVWNFAVGDEGMTRALVRSYMTKIVEG